jgi:hypothetical protein
MNKQKNTFKGAYHACKWRRGVGCLSCEAEREKAHSGVTETLKRRELAGKAFVGVIVDDDVEELAAEVDRTSTSQDEGGALWPRQ